MRNVIIGVLTGAGFCVFVLGALGAYDGYANPDHYPPSLLPGTPRPVVGCFWALAYFGFLATPVGAVVGGILGAAVTGARRLAEHLTGKGAR
jgi:hypothetical protein